MGEQRHNFSLELQNEIRAYGHQPLKPGNSEQPPAGKSRAIPVEVSSVESSSLRAYECLLADTETRFPPPTERILTRQKNGILASLRSEWIP